MIIIWEVASGAQRMTLKGHTDRVECVAFSHDGKRLASGNNNRTIILWDLTSGKPLELLRGHTNSLMNVAFTPDGKGLVSNAFEGTFIVWNLGMPRQQALLAGHKADVRTVAASPDGATLASGSDDKTVRLWDAVTGQERAVLKEHRGEIQTVAFSPDGRLLASGGDDDRRIIFWDVKSGRQLKEIDGHGSITSVAFNPDSKFLASAAEGRSAIFLWDVTSGEQQAELLGHETDAESESLEFSRDGKVLVSGGREGAIRLWDVSARREIVEPMGRGGSVMKVAISPDGRMVASSADLTGTVLLWDLGGSKEPVELDTGGSWSGNSVAYSPDGKTLAYTSGEPKFNIVLWDLENGKPRGRLEALATTLSMAFTPDGRRLVTGHSNGEVALWGVDVEGWSRRACEIANRNLTFEEWKTFVSEDLPYRTVCPELPVPKD
jgi:WD40 repeat protein